MCVLAEDYEESGGFLSDAVKEYESGLTGFAISLLKDHDRAKDVVQDTFISLNRQDPAKFDGGNLKSWLFTVCRNRCLDLIRKDKRLNPLEDSHLRLVPSEEPEPGSLIELDERHLQIQAYLQRLSENQRDVIILKFQQGMSYAEISEHTGLSVGNVGFLLHAGLKKLRALLPEDLRYGN